jgi:hypothetical protein
MFSGEAIGKPPPSIIRGCVNIATVPVLPHRTVGIRRGIGGAISQNRDFLLCEEIATQTVYTWPRVEICIAPGLNTHGNATKLRTFGQKLARLHAGLRTRYWAAPARDPMPPRQPCAHAGAMVSIGQTFACNHDSQVYHGLGAGLLHHPVKHLPYCNASYAKLGRYHRRRLTLP